MQFRAKSSFHVTNKSRLLFGACIVAAIAMFSLWMYLDEDTQAPLSLGDTGPQRVVVAQSSQDWQGQEPSPFGRRNGSQPIQSVETETETEIQINYWLSKAHCIHDLLVAQKSSPVQKSLAKPDDSCTGVSIDESLKAEMQIIDWAVKGNLQASVPAARILLRQHLQSVNGSISPQQDQAASGQSQLNPVDERILANLSRMANAENIEAYLAMADLLSAKGGAQQKLDAQTYMEIVQKIRNGQAVDLPISSIKP